MKDKIIKEVEELERESQIMVKDSFEIRLRDLLKKEGILKCSKDTINTSLKDCFNEKIKKIKNEIKKIDSNKKLLKKVEELESVNEHIRKIYKRDLKKELASLKLKKKKLKKPKPKLRT